MTTKLPESLKAYTNALRHAYVNVGVIDGQTQDEKDEGFHRLDLTVMMLSEFGHEVTVNDDGAYVVKAGKHFKLS